MSSIEQAIPATERVARRRAVPRFRLTRDGLSTLVFLLPLLLVFGLFSWFPILRALVMSVQETNLVSDADVRRPRQLRARAGRSAARDRRRQHRLVRAPCAGLRLPDPDHPRGPDERGPARPRALQRPRLPAGRHPAGRVGPALAVLLRRLGRRRVQHRRSAGSGSARCRGSRTRGPRCRRSSSRRPGRPPAAR